MNISSLEPSKLTETNSKVFFDVQADNEPLGRIEIALYDNVVPKTVKNFKALAKGKRRILFLVLQPST